MASWYGVSRGRMFRRNLAAHLQELGIADLDIHSTTMYVGAMYPASRKSPMAWSKELIAASATPLILSVLAQGENYGYAISKRVADLTGGEMQWTDGMLYPVLHRLEKQRYVKSEWKVVESGRRRKYYRLQKEGAKKLSEERNRWEVVHHAFMSLWEPKPCSI